MGLNKYGTTLPGRSSLFLNYLTFNDVAIIEYGTQGHMIFNFSQYFQSNIDRRMEGVYNTSLGEMDLVLGCDDRLYEASTEAKEDGYKNIFLMPSALGDVMGFDLKYYASDIGAINNINCFTASIKSDASFYLGEEAFYNSLIPLLKNNSNKYNGYGISIIGDSNFFINKKKHQEIRNFLKEYLALNTIYDSLELHNLKEVERLKEANLTVVTTKSALGLAIYLKNEFNIPYYYFNSIDLLSLNNDLKEIEELLGVKRIKELKDNYYDGIIFQFKNIMEYFSNRKLILYLNVDNLIATRKLLDGLNINYEAYSIFECPSYKHITIDECIDRFNSKEYFVIGNDIVSANIDNSISIEEIRLDYTILTPIEVPYTLLNGCYKLIKLICDKIFKN